MKRTILSGIFIFLIIFGIGCNESLEDVSVQDLVDGKVEEGTKVNVTGIVIFGGNIIGDEADNELDEPTQVVPLADEETGRTVKTYNELDVTKKELEKGEKTTVEAIYKGKDEDFTIIQVTKIEE